MNLERMKEVLTDEAFVKRLFSLETAEEVQEALLQKDVELTLEEIEQAAGLLNRYQAGDLSEKEEKAIEAAQSHQDGELSDEELEEVAGGFVWFVFMALAICACVTAGMLKATNTRW